MHTEKGRLRVAACLPLEFWNEAHEPEFSCQLFEEPRAIW